MIGTFTVIGGASAYTPGLIAALLHHRETLTLRDVRLYDIDQDRLEIVAKLGHKMAKAVGASFDVRGVTSLDDAVRGTDVILNSSRPGGLTCRRLDETLPLEFGVPGQETVGPGGFFFALRSVPAALELAATIERVAPAAVLLNYTNPTNIVTQALTTTAVTVLGLCDQSDEDLHDLALAAKLDGAATFDCVGLNHATWYRDIRFGDRVLPPLDQLEAPAHLSGSYRLRFDTSLAIAKSHPGYWPNSYLAYYERPEAFVRQAQQDGIRADKILKSLPAYFLHFEEEGAKEVPDLRHHRGSEGFGDMAVNVLRALGAERPTRAVLNVAGRGAVPMFDPDTIVEVPCDVCSTDVVRMVGRPLAADQQPLLEALERYQRQTADAAASHDPKAAVAALAENPLIGDAAMAAAMFDRAQQEYGREIPMFE